MMKYMHLKNTFDVIVVGGGPAGVKAAMEAASRGLDVAIIDEKQRITGAPTGTHSKCMREALLHGAKDWPAVAKAVQDSVQVASGMAMRRLLAFHVKVMQGRAVVKDKNTLDFLPTPAVINGVAEEVEPQSLTFETLVIATGSKAYQRPPTDFTLPGVYDTDTIWDLDRIPKRMVVQGAGIIGLEYAVILKKLGCETIVLVDPMPTILPMLDVSLQEACKETAKQNDLEIVLQTMFDAVEALPGSTDADPQLRITLAGGRVLECDCLLSATGRYGCSAGLGLENLEGEGLKIGRGFFVQTDDWGYTGCGKIYAAGDVAGGALATIAQSQAARAIRHAYGSGKVKEEKAMAVKPSAVWTIPEMAWAGMTEADCVKQGLVFDMVKIPFSRSLRAAVAGVAAGHEEDGFLKLIYQKDDDNVGKVLGVHMFGETSADHINFGAQIVDDGENIHDILKFVFPAVTYHELYTIAATEAKLKLINKGSAHLEASVIWKRIARMVEAAASEANSTVAQTFKEMFEIMDEDRSGFISIGEFKEALKNGGLILTDEEVSELFMEAAGTEEGAHLDYFTFLKVFNPEAAQAGSADTEGQVL